MKKPTGGKKPTGEKKNPTPQSNAGTTKKRRDPGVLLNTGSFGPDCVLSNVSPLPGQNKARKLCRWISILIEEKGFLVSFAERSRAQLGREAKKRKNFCSSSLLHEIAATRDTCVS